MADDLYSGFNDYNSALDTAVRNLEIMLELALLPIKFQELINDEGFQQAVARTSHGRRPVSILIY